VSYAPPALGPTKSECPLPWFRTSTSTSLHIKRFFSNFVFSFCGLPERRYSPFFFIQPFFYDYGEIGKRTTLRMWRSLTLWVQIPLVVFFTSCFLILALGARYRSLASGPVACLPTAKVFFYVLLLSFLLVTPSTILLSIGGHF
jgi:hypothetical protein